MSGGKAQEKPDSGTNVVAWNADNDPWLIRDSKGRARNESDKGPSERTLQCFMPVGSLSSIVPKGKKTGQEWHPEEMPLADMDFKSLMEKGDELLEIGRKNLMDGMAGMGAPVPWLAPLPTSSPDPNMFIFGREPKISINGPHFFGRPSEGGM